MRTRRLSAVLAALSIPLLGGGAFAVAGAVSTQPKPQVIIPSRTSSVSSTSARGHDDPATHDANDDHGKDKSGPTTSNSPGDDPAGHDRSATTVDDHGHDGTTGTTTPDDHGHDGTPVTTGTTIPDDHGHDPVTVTTTPDDHGGKSGHDDTTVTTTPDDHGGKSGPGH
jgi:hypothetical protein